MNDLHICSISIHFIKEILHWIPEFNNGIMFIHNIYLASRYYYVNLIRAKSAFTETLRNAWNLSSKFDDIQNVCALSHYTKTYHVSQWDCKILHVKFITLRYLLQMPLNGPYPGKKWPKKLIFTFIWIQLTLTQRCRSISKLVWYYLKNVGNY